MIDLAECWWQRDLRDSAATIGRHWERELLLKRKVHPEIKCKKAQSQHNLYQDRVLLY